MSHIPIRYIPKSLSKSDRERQIRQIEKSRKMYKQHKYLTRKNIKSFASKRSKYITEAERIYRIRHISPNNDLAKKSGCSLSALKKIMNKGEGAYYSSGSRPNQTAFSWGKARLASSLTGGKAAVVDFDILKKGCDHSKIAYQMARRRVSRAKESFHNFK